MLHLVKTGRPLVAEAHPRARIVNPALAFDEKFHDALMDLELPILTDAQVRTEAVWFLGFGGYVVSCEHLVRHLKDVAPEFMEGVGQWAGYIHLPEGCAELQS